MKTTLEDQKLYQKEQAKKFILIAAAALDVNVNTKTFEDDYK